MATDDMVLLREYALSGSEEVFATLVSRHINLVHSVALRQIGDAHLAEEITQAVFIILARKAKSLGAKTILPGWLCRTARYASANALTIQRRRQRREQEAHMQSLLNESESDALSRRNPTEADWTQIAPLLDGAMERLGEKDHNAIVLRFFEGKSFMDVGAALGASEDAAKKRVNRALEKLRRFFTKRGVSSTTAVIAGTISSNSIQAAPAALAKSVTAVAIAKGAAASGSTLTLINGALKIMAWTKAKTAITAGTAILLAGGAGIVTTKIVHVARVAHYPDIQGSWEGVMLLDYDGVRSGEAARTHVVLKLAKTNGVYNATTDWIEMGRKDVPMGNVVYDFPSLLIKRNPRNTWKLRVNADATQMVLDHAIHFIQPDPVLFLRTSTPDPIPERLAETEFSPRANSDLQGYWKGEFDAGSNAQPVNLKIAELANGTFRAEVGWPEYGVEGLPVTVSYRGSQVKFADDIGHGLFQGTINDDHTEMIGSWTRRGQSVPASLKRADYRAEHTLDADKDYSFRSENDLQGHWKGSWVVTLAKTKAIIRLALDIAKLPDGSYSATLSNVDQFGNDGPVPPSDFKYDRPNVRMKWKWIGGAYEGTLKNGKLVGVWLQSGGSFPLVFERSKSR
jgi:RNA polymerase sigma factor (sigma-70 family)